MKCFNHHERDAFGICKVCGKGLCLECMNNEKGIITCKNTNCKSKVQQIKIWQIILLVILFIGVIMLIID